MSIHFRLWPRRAGIFLLPLLFSACSPQEEAISIPPQNPPLSQPALGYGVVMSSYTRMMSEPGDSGVSLGYVRERSILAITERRLVQEGEGAAYWVKAESGYSGWLPEKVLRIYDTLEKAGTAVEKQAER